MLSLVSETLLQAIGMIINVVDEKVKDTVVDELKLTLVMLLQTTQVSSKYALKLDISVVIYL